GSGGVRELREPITHYQLPITNYPLPITHYQLPITKFNPPTCVTNSHNIWIVSRTLLSYPL
ncbi:MAG TPA: hypothetical protein DC064_26830, partial [Cyanobacteria bacterium UBA9273]|nr:hypothetical protein [Cyanobacteria bacterium UBA9273]